MDIRTSTATITSCIKAFEGLTNTRDADLVFQSAQKLSLIVKETIENLKEEKHDRAVVMSFNEPELPRYRRPSSRLKNTTAEVETVAPPQHDNVHKFYEDTTLNHL